MAVAADKPEKLQVLIDEYGVDPGFVLLSDPDLLLADRLKIPLSRMYPKAKIYPKGAFMQPSAFLFPSTGEVRFEWRIKPKLFNLFGAARRMTVGEVLAELEKLAG